MDADVVVPVPDSGVPAALGYAQEPAACRSRWASSAATTWAAPSSSRPKGVRELGVRMKHSPNRAALAGKRVVLIDDSIVRGHHLGEDRAHGARSRRQGGAPALRLAADHVAGLLRHRHARPRQAAGRHPDHGPRCAELLEVDSLGFLSVDGLYWAMGAGPRDAACPQFTDHYFTGDYPTRLLDREIAEGRNTPVERQLSLLSA